MLVGVGCICVFIAYFGPFLRKLCSRINIFRLVNVFWALAAISLSSIWYTFSTLYLFCQHFAIMNLSYLPDGTVSVFSIKLVIHPSVSVVIWLKNFLMLENTFKSKSSENFLLELFQLFNKQSLASSYESSKSYFLSSLIENRFGLVLMTNLDSSYSALSLAFGLRLRQELMMLVTVAEYFGVSGIVNLLERTFDLLSKGNFR